MGVPVRYTPFGPKAELGQKRLRGGVPPEKFRNRRSPCEGSVKSIVTPRSQYGQSIRVLLARGAAAKQWLAEREVALLPRPVPPCVHAASSISDIAPEQGVAYDPLFKAAADTCGRM